MSGSRSRAAAMVLLAWTAGALAQTTGSIEGRVEDSSGGALPGVAVEAASASLQGGRSAVTGRDGTYRFPGTPPGAYSIRATLPGFGPAEKTATVSLDATASVNFVLRLEAREEVIVSGEIPLVDVTSTTAGTNYVASVIARLPVARNYADIVRANPGVSTDLGETQGRSLALTIYGASSVENQWIVDGVNTTNVIKGFQGKALNNEFIQEVEVKTGGYQAEYGRALGGIINVITKSGGNQFHGDGFVYYDSSTWRAEQEITGEDATAGGMRVVDYRRTDFGADLGGYLWKDRLWFFGAYDRVQVPVEVSRYASNSLVSSDLRFPIHATDTLYSGKLTWNARPGTSVVGTVFSDPTKNTGAGAANPREGGFSIHPISNPYPGTWEATRYVGGADYSLRASEILGSTALVAVQAARHRDRYELQPAGSGAAVSLTDLTCSGGTRDARCELPPEPNFVTGGFGRIFGTVDRNTSTRDQVRGDVNLYPGAHEIKIGGDFERSKTQAVSSFSGGQRVTRFNQYGEVYYQHQFFAASPTDLTPVDNTVRPQTNDIGAYIQDSWRLAPGWTVNAGVRWDQEDIRDYRNVSVIKTRQWQPRLGIVWDPGKDGKTKMYAFVGRFSYALPTDLSVRAYGASTFVTTFNFDPVSLVQDPAVFKNGRARIFGGTSSEPVDDGLKGIYQDEIAVGVERLLSPTFSVALKGTYRRLGRAIEDRCDLGNIDDGTYCGFMNPGSSGTIARGNLPGCDGLEEDVTVCTDTVAPAPPARRLYRGVEIVGRKAVSEKLWLQASYVYSSVRGNYDGEVSSIEAGQTDPGLNADFDYAAYFHDSYGRLSQDRPHKVRLDGYYATPWKLWFGLQAFYQSGAPLSRIGYFSFGFSDIQLVPKGYEGRLPAVWDANLTIGYPLAVGPVTVTAQLYVFNLFNNQIRTSQDMVWSSNRPADYPASLFDPNQEQNNPEYGKITGRQEPRLFRGAIRISF